MFLAKVLVLYIFVFFNCCITNTTGNSRFELKDTERIELKSQDRQERKVEESVAVANTDKCASLHCHNGGICKIIENEAVCECPEEYKGYTCETHKCDGIMECKNNGICKVERGRAVCVCPDDYGGSTCEYYKCDKLKCQNNGTCKVKEGEAKCECSEGYKGEYCEFLSTELCSKYQPNCEETGGFCLDGENAKIRCKCRRDDKYINNTGCQTDRCGWSISNCLERGGVCQRDENGNIMCRCPKGMEYKEHNGEKGCRVLNETCSRYQPNCEETGGFCLPDENENIECKCPRYTSYVNDTGCQVSTDTCKLYRSKCINTEGYCMINKDGELQCKCPNGMDYSEYGCQVFDPCTDYADYNLCENGGTCLTQGKSFKCICKEAFTGRRCDEVKNDFCSTYDPSCVDSGGYCIIENEKIKCKCPKYTSYIQDKGCQVESCDRAISGCEESGGTCVSFKGEVRCRCPKGMEFGRYHCKVRKGACSRFRKNCEETGGTCETDMRGNIKCECPWIANFNNDYGCEVSNGTCRRYEENCMKTGGYCMMSKYGELECACPKGTEYSETGCVASDPCEDNPCLNKGTCISEGTEFRCVCKQPFTGKLCKNVEKNMCSRYKKNCVETGGTCISDENGGIECECPFNLTYKNDVGCTDTSDVHDPCKDNPCLNDGKCIAWRKHFQCLCKEPFTGTLCKDVQKGMCSRYKKNCENTGGTCITDKKGKIECECPFNATYKNDIGCADPCSQEPCFNGGQCYVIDEKFVCVCQAPFSGKYCEIRFQKNTALYIVIGVLVCLVFISVASSICCWIRLRKK